MAVFVNQPPVAQAGPDHSVAIDEPIEFDAGASFDRDGTLIAYDWNFGDGATGGGAEIDATPTPSPASIPSL